jgi:hypothetical protein
VTDPTPRPAATSSPPGATAGSAQPFPAPTRTVRLRFDRSTSPPSGTWWPYTFDYSAELHDLVHASRHLIGGRIDRISFEWNKRSINHRHWMTTDDLVMTGPAPGQRPGEMRLYGAHGRQLNLTVVAPRPERVDEPPTG